MSSVPVLCDGIAVRDHGMVLHSDQTNPDVLPPFAGG